MKKYLKIFIISFGVLLLSFLGYQVYSKASYKVTVEKELQTIPQFSFQTLDGTLFSNNDLNKNQSTIFIYFNSDCDFCQHEAKSIQENIKLFKEIQLVFVSYEEKDAIRSFSNQHKLDIHDNIIFLSDTRDDFSNRFDATSIPYILTYNQDHKLVKKHKGQLNINSMLEGL